MGLVGLFPICIFFSSGLLDRNDFHNALNWCAHALALRSRPTHPSRPHAQVWAVVLNFSARCSQVGACAHRGGACARTRNGAFVPAADHVVCRAGMPPGSAGLVIFRPRCVEAD
jgi:hypothetical protein